VPNWLFKLLFLCRSCVSYLALGGSLAALGWFSLKLEAVPGVQIPRSELERAPLVIVDAGHGGHDGGAVAGGVIEKDLSLILAGQLQDQLKKAGIRVRMTRDKDRFLELEERCRVASESHADAFVSVHLNTNPATEIQGIETYFSSAQSLMARPAKAAERTKKPGSGEQLARTIQRHACSATKAENRGAKDSQLIVVMRTPCPAALVECGFLTNAEEVRRMKRKDYQQKLVAGIAEGVVDFLHHRMPVSVAAVKTP
jgi:N-acetylmuramoyl-L-alanine amidase